MRRQNVLQNVEQPGFVPRTYARLCEERHAPRQTSTVRQDTCVGLAPCGITDLGPVSQSAQVQFTRKYCHRALVYFQHFPVHVSLRKFFILVVFQFYLI